MKTKLFLLLPLVTLLMASCKSTNSNSSIPYTKAERYFVKNTVKDGSILLMRFVNQEKFDEYFGTAAVMGQNGKPTPIDFDKQYVIAIIHPSTENDVSFSSYNLQETEDRIVVNYKIKKGREQSYTSRPYLLLVVDQKYSKNIRFNRVE